MLKGLANKKTSEIEISWLLNFGWAAKKAHTSHYALQWHLLLRSCRTTSCMFCLFHWVGEAGFALVTSLGILWMQTLWQHVHGGWTVLDKVPVNWQQPSILFMHGAAHLEFLGLGWPGFSNFPTHKNKLQVAIILLWPPWVLNAYFFQTPLPVGGRLTVKEKLSTLYKFTQAEQHS